MLKILEFAVGLWHFLGLTSLAAALVAAGISVSGLSARLTPAGWVAVTPLLYFAWVVTYLALSALTMQTLFRSYEKPRHATFVFEKGYDGPNHLGLAICYVRAYLIRYLPLMHMLRLMPGIRQLSLLAYAPHVHFGKNVFYGGFLYDPDLTELGDEVILGGGSILCAHSATWNNRRQCVYASAPIRIGDRATIGGETRVGMGVTIGADAVVEAGSNVFPFTCIPPAEVWGGNPAVFLRKRLGFEAQEPEQPENASGSAGNTVAELATRPVMDPALEAARVVAQALTLRLDESPAGLAAAAAWEWDSLGQLAIAAALNDAEKCQLLPEQILQLRSLSDVEQAVRQFRRESRPVSEASPKCLPSDPEWLPLLPTDVATRLLSQATALPNTAQTPLRIQIAASFTAEPLAASLRPWCAAFGIAAQVEFCGFNQITQTLLAADSPFHTNPGGLNVVLLRLEDLPQDIATARQCLSDTREAIQRFVSTSGGVAKLLVGSLPPPLLTNLTGPRQQTEALRVEWLRGLAETEGVEVFEFAGAVERVGLSAAGDSGLDVLARAPYSAAVYRELGIELARLARRQRRPPAKVLALDCDGTLWGGVIAEDGLEGIQVGPDGPGRSYQLFQRALLQLKQRGVLLVLVSRNEEQDVWEALEQHPGMLLHREDLAAWRINWHPKSQSLRELAAELQLGLDSFVFIDDDPAVRLHVESHLPQVHVFPTPAEPSKYTEALAKLWVFDTAQATAEDAARTELLQQERERQQTRETSLDLASYLQSLELNVELRVAQRRDLARVAQLTQKTNQFNLSLRRRTLEEISGLDSNYCTLVLSARDRFGDYGQIGVCILRSDSEQAGRIELDTFLVSCRALGRGLEEAMLHGVFEIARQLNGEVLQAPYEMGPRNQPARTFFAASGFRDRGGQVFETAQLTGPPLPSHLRFTLLGPHREPSSALSKQRNSM